MPPLPRRAARIPLRSAAAYGAHTVHQAVQLRKQSLKSAKTRPLSLRAIAHAVGVKSPDTIRKWLGVAQRAHARTHAVLKRGRKFLLNRDQERLIHGWLLCEVSNHRSVLSDDVIAFVSEVFHQHVSTMWVSNFNKRWRISVGKAFERTSKQIDVNYLNSCVEFSKKILDMKLPPDKIFVMDEKGIWSTPRAARTLRPMGRFE